MNNDTPGTDDGQGGEARAYVAGIQRGVRVTSGQHIGWIGDSGNAENTVSHLHFEIQEPSRAHINPYESLLASAATALMTIAPPGLVQHAEIPAFDLDPKFRDAIAHKLSLDTHGEMIQLLQIKLKDLGFYASSYITNYFDQITRDAVIRLQRTYGLEPTGIVDYKVRVILNKGSGFEEPAQPVMSLASRPMTYKLLMKEGR